MASSPRLALTYLVASQAQKEISHNEALNDLDVLVQPVVSSMGLSAPPAAPLDGDCYVVGSAATGGWSGHDGEIAFYYSGWRFKTPSAGWSVYVEADGAFALYNGSSWELQAKDMPFTWDPGTVADNAGISSAPVSVAGASFGDYVAVAAPYSLQGVLATGYVSAAGYVVVRLHNATGSGVVFGSGVWKLRVTKG